MPSTSRPSATVPAHLSSRSDDWPTPARFFATLDAEFGFVLDVCASTANRKADSFYALDHPDEYRRDGLAGNWAADAAHLDGAVWMNPPYGRPISAWMAKAFTAAQAGAVVVTLVPVRADTAWWHTHVLATGAEVRYVRGRLTFGDAVHTAAFASAVVIYRPTDVVGAPGPVGVMRARPDVRATEPASMSDAVLLSRRAERRRSTAATHGVGKACAGTVDCICCRRETTEVVEHLFDSREWVEVADTVSAGDHHA